MPSVSNVSSPHFVIFPFMSKGHTIPALHLAHLLWSRNISVTIFTTPANSPSIHTYLTHTTDISIIDLPFPKNIDGVPPGVENTENLKSMSMFLSFANATKQMQPHFEKALKSLHSVSCLISDGFLGWTQQSAEKLGIPRLTFYGMNNFSPTMCEIMVRERPHITVGSDDEPFSVPYFPWLKLTRNDFEPPFNQVDPKGPYFEFVMEQCLAMYRSQGLIVNSFYELEPGFNDYWNQKIGPKAWCIGPLCLAKPLVSQKPQNPTWVQWLDKKLAERQSVLYVAFGTQAEISPEQLYEIALGLEQSEVSFLWVVRSKGLGFLEGFEERVKGRGILVQDWVDQMEILVHESVTGFLSHCGWNSVIESICAHVPILALPLMAEQHLNARMVVEAIGVGLRVMPSNGGSVRGFVKMEEVDKMVRELMGGERGKAVRKKVKKVGEAASAAMKEYGSSSHTLDLLIDEFRGLPKSIKSA